MREISNKEQKEIMLEIMDNIHLYCVNNKIRYTLGYGTLLGAVRHNGYIPWDDDIDILMFRKDYEIFKEGFNRQENCPFKLVDRKINHDYFLLQPKVIDTRTTLIDGIKNSEQLGVWIDIFVIDYLSNDEATSNKMLDKSILYNLTIRSHYMSRTSPRSFLKKTIFNIMCLFEGVIDLDKVLNKIEHKFVQTEYKNYCGAIVQNYPTKNSAWESAWFNEYELHDFECRKYYVVKEYDALLKKEYKDYWILPKENERVTHHSGKLYWK